PRFRDESRGSRQIPKDDRSLVSSRDQMSIRAEGQGPDRPTLSAKDLDGAPFAGVPLLLFDVPETDHLVLSRGREASSILAEGEARHHFALRFAGLSQLLPGRGIPEVHPLVLSGGGQHLAVRAWVEGQGPDL